MNPYTIITTGAALENLCRQLTEERELAVDLEMDSLHHYREKVCLIQISTRSASWLIDPLAISDLSPLTESLGAPQTLVVMHGADYDIRSLHRDFSIEVNSLFDTMLASRFLGVMEFGLAALLKSRFGVVLDKKYQKADWSRRPLSPEMCGYAVADTAYLLPLYDQLKRELEQKNRLAWLEEECSLVCQARVTEKEGPLFLFCKGAGKLKGRNLAALELLLQIRDHQARVLDRPPFKVIPADTLIDIASAMPHSSEELSGIKGMTQKLYNRYGEKMLAAVSAAKAMPEQEVPRFPRNRKEDPSEGAKHRMKLLKNWREQQSAFFELDPGVLAPNWLLENVADAAPARSETLDTINGMRQWQKRLYGHDLLQFSTG